MALFKCGMCEFTSQYVTEGSVTYKRVRTVIFLKSMILYVISLISVTVDSLAAKVVLSAAGALFGS